MAVRESVFTYTRRKNGERSKVVSKEVRNRFLRNQKVLTRRIFDISVLTEPRMMELVELVKHQGWMHLMEGPTSSHSL